MSKKKKVWTKIRRGIKYPILVLLIRMVTFLVRISPRKPLLKGSAALGAMAFHLVRGERLKTIENLTLAFGKEKTPEEIYRMAREVFINQALNFIDYVHAINYKTRQQFAKIMDIEGEEYLREAYDEGNGVICLMSHTGSWEFSAIMPPVMGYETTAVSRPMPNPQIDKLIVAARENRGMKNLSRGKVYPLLIEALKKKECLIIMIDQDTQAPGVFVDFFDRSAYTPVGAARLALDTLAPVVPVFIKRQPNNRHCLTILPRLPFVNTGNREHDLLENTIIYTKAIEDFIRPNPTQWVWMHNRWKTTPEEIAHFYEEKRLKAMAATQGNT
jgi:KDO2-lipid IV(A) lauroyltransferase